MNAPRDRKLIVVIVRRDGGYDRGVLRGIVEAARPIDGWRLRNIPYDAGAAEAIRLWRPDGVIGRIANRELAATLRTLRIPAVGISHALATHAFPRVGVDDRAVGRMAAEHFIERGFLRFGYVPMPGRWAFSEDRCRGFVERLQAAGLDANVAAPAVAPADGMVLAPNPALVSWAQGLEAPAAVLAANDQQASRFCDACREVGIAMPDDLAILGVDNDELLCEMSDPPLSSIALPARQVGERAVALLVRLLAGEALPHSPILLPPEGIVMRRSTETLAVSDVKVATALRFVRDNASRPLRVADVLRAVPMARRGLEQRFRSVLGRSPLSEINHAHVHRARELLAHTDLSLDQVAERSGLVSRQRLSTLFRRFTGHTPAAYRRLFRR